MKKATILLIVGLLLSTVLVVSCYRLPWLPTPTAEAPVTVTDDELKEVIYKNLEAMVEEDVAAYMATIHEDSPAYDSTEEMMRQLFAQYDITYELESVEVVSKAASEARIRVVQVTKKVSGPDELRDTRMTIVHILKPSDGVWKIYDSTVEYVEYLN